MVPQSFHTTRWSLVVRAGADASSQTQTALEELCRLYWYPLYAFVRREGVSAAEAEDLTQSFFSSLLERDDLQSVSPERGKFRSFLRTAMKHFLLNYWRNERAQKRGGGKRTLSLDFERAEDRFSHEPTDELTPERLYDRQWALMVLELATQSLEQDYRDAGKGPLFDLLKPYLTGSDETSPYASVAEQLELTEGAVRTAMHRLRKDFRTALRTQVAETLDETIEPDGEIRLLFEALTM